MKFFLKTKNRFTNLERCVGHSVRKIHVKKIWNKVAIRLEREEKMKRLKLFFAKVYFPAHSFLVIYSTQNPKDTCQSSQQSGEPRNYDFSKNKIFSNINLHPHLMHMTSAVAKTKQQSHQMALKIETSPRKIFFKREVSTLGSDKETPTSSRPNQVSE